MTTDTSKSKSTLITEEGVPFEPSDTVFRKALVEDGKSIEEAQYAALVAGEARADTWEGWIRHQISLVWKKVIAWAGGIIAVATAALLAYGTDKVTAVVEAITK